MAGTQYIKEGWRPHGAGRCRCPHCGGTSSTNALARAKHKCLAPDALDANGKPLRVGDIVRAIEFGPKAMLRKVEAIGSGEHFDGYVRVAGSIAWESARHFAKAL